MAIYLVKPYEAKKDELENLYNRFFPGEDRSKKLWQIENNHHCLLRKHYINGEKQQQVFPILFEWIKKLEEDISLEALASELDEINEKGLNVALLQTRLSVKKGEPFRKRNMPLVSERIVLFDIDDSEDIALLANSQETSSRLSELFCLFQDKTSFLPKDTGYLIRGSGSFGLREGGRIQIFTRLNKPTDRRSLKNWIKGHTGGRADEMAYSAGQLWFIAPPILENTAYPYSGSNKCLLIEGSDYNASSIPICSKIDRIFPAQTRPELKSVDIDHSLRKEIFRLNSFSQMESWLTSNRRILPNRRNEIFYWLVGRSVDLGFSNEFIQWLANQDLFTEGKWDRKGLEEKKEHYIKAQIKHLGITPISENRNFEHTLKLKTKELKEYLPEILELSKEGRVLIAIKSDMGTGKTELMKSLTDELRKDKSISNGAYIAPLRAIADANGNKVGMTFMLPRTTQGYEEVSVADKKNWFSKNEWVATTDISIKYDEQDRDIVIFDELDLTLNNISSDGIQIDLNYLIQEKAIRSKIIIILDADMTDELVGRFIDKVNEYDEGYEKRRNFLISNKGTYHEGRENILIPTPAHALAWAVEQMKQGKRVFIHTDHSDKDGELTAWRNLLEERLKDNDIEGYGFAFDRENAPSEVRGSQREKFYLSHLEKGLKFTIHSPITKKGWDILLTEENHFEVALGIYTHGYTQAKDIKQGGGRARRAGLCGYCVFGKSKIKRDELGSLIYSDTYIEEEKVKEIMERITSKELSLTSLQKQFFTQSQICKEIALIKPLFTLARLIEMNGEVYRWMEYDLSVEAEYRDYVKESVRECQESEDLLFLAREDNRKKLARSYTNLEAKDLNTENVRDFRKRKDSFDEREMEELAYLHYTLSAEEGRKLAKDRANKHFRFPRLMQDLISAITEGLETEDFYEWIRGDSKSLKGFYSQKDQENLKDLLLDRGLGLEDSFTTGGREKPSLKRCLTSFFKKHDLIMTEVQPDKVTWTLLYQDYRANHYKNGFRQTWKAEEKKAYIRDTISKKILNKDTLTDIEISIAIKYLQYWRINIEKPHYWLKKVSWHSNMDNCLERIQQY